MSQEFRIKVTIDTPLENAPSRFLQFMDRFLRNHSWHDTLDSCSEGLPIWHKQVDVDARTDKGQMLKIAWVKHFRSCDNCTQQGPFRTINHTNFQDIKIELVA